jgi:AcrR family transcriptional regulator
MTIPKLRKPTRRFSRKNEAVLDAAAALVNTRGLKGVTLADVARQVGLVTTSVTYYFRRKEDLAAACLLRSVRAIEVIADAAQALPDRRRVRADGSDIYSALGVPAVESGHAPAGATDQSPWL